MRNRLTLLMGVGATLVALAGCGNTSNSSSQSSSSAGSTTAAAAPGASSSSTSQASLGSCGTLPNKPPQDPDGAVKGLSAAAQQAYNGFAYPVYKSAWANWKAPQRPLTIAISWTAPINDFAAGVLATVAKELRADHAVGKVIVSASPSPADIPGQIQQFRTMLEQKPDLIVGSTTNGSSAIPLVQAAAKQGVPTISALSTIPSPDAINVVPNNYLAAAQTLAQEMKYINGKGTVLEVHGIPGISVDSDAFRAFSDVLAHCPGVHVAGQITGQFAPAQAKAQTLQFLGTHPQTINAVAQAGGMATGIISAFKQAGRPVPPVNDLAATKGSLGYWINNRTTYKGTATGGGAAAFGTLLAQVVERVIAGDQIKVSDVLQPQPLITPANLSQWAQTSWNISTPGTAPDPAGVGAPAPLLDPLFKK